VKGSGDWDWEIWKLSNWGIANLLWLLFCIVSG
jgi:hypothetical protein